MPSFKPEIRDINTVSSDTYAQDLAAAAGKNGSIMYVDHSGHRYFVVPKDQALGLGQSAKRWLQGFRTNPRKVASFVHRNLHKLQQVPANAQMLEKMSIRFWTSPRAYDKLTDSAEALNKKILEIAPPFRFSAQAKAAIHQDLERFQRELAESDDTSSSTPHPAQGPRQNSSLPQDTARPLPLSAPAQSAPFQGAASAVPEHRSPSLLPASARSPASSNSALIVVIPWTNDELEIVGRFQLHLNEKDQQKVYERYKEGPQGEEFLLNELQQQLLLQYLKSATGRKNYGFYQSQKDSLKARFNCDLGYLIISPRVFTVSEQDFPKALEKEIINGLVLFAGHNAAVRQRKAAARETADERTFERFQRDTYRRWSSSSSSGDVVVSAADPAFNLQSVLADVQRQGKLTLQHKEQLQKYSSSLSQQEKDNLAKRLAPYSKKHKRTAASTASAAPASKPTSPAPSSVDETEEPSSPIAAAASTASPAPSSRSNSSHDEDDPVVFVTDLKALQKPVENYSPKVPFNIWVKKYPIGVYKFDETEQSEFRTGVEALNENDAEDLVPVIQIALEIIRKRNTQFITNSLSRHPAVKEKALKMNTLLYNHDRAQVANTVAALVE